MSDNDDNRTLSESLESIKSEMFDEMTDTENASVNTSYENIPQNKEDKYEDDNTYESWGDVNIFFPIATKLIEPLKNLGLTPNHVTYLSTIFTFLSIYYLEAGDKMLSAMAYFTGYTLDCVDGRMARKYNMSSKYGMALDLVSDNVSNLSLIGYLISKYGPTNEYILLILGMSYMISVSYGLNEAIASYKKSGNDNFYERRLLELKEEDELIFKLFLMITKTSYFSYKQFFPKYDEEKINKWLKVLKHFGPGNYCLMVIYVLINIH